MTKHTSKGKWQSVASLHGFDLKPSKKRQKNGQPRRPADERGADQVALKARCRQRGAKEGAEQMRESRGEWWGCNAGRVMAQIVSGNEERSELWDAIVHMRKVVTAYDRAIGAPSRHATCLRLLLPPEEMSADASTAPKDERTDEEKQRQAVSALMTLDGWLGYTDKAAASEAKRVVLDDARVIDPVGLMSALRCVSDGVKGRRMVWRGRG